MGPGGSPDVACLPVPRYNLQAPGVDTPDTTLLTPSMPALPTIESSASRRLVVLGSGTSTGVPVLGCDCAVCTSPDPHNRRTRPSVLVELPAGRILFDTTPEMRMQLLRESVPFVHAIVYTHAHADHLFGLDDARLFPRHLGGPVPIYCEPETEAAIRSVFSYAFQDETRRYPSGGVPQLRFQPIAPGVPFEVLGQRLLPLRLDHGRFRVLGFRIDSLAYCTDVSRIPEESWATLEGVETLILDALRPEPHPTHFHLQAALEVIERLAPRRAFLTHLSHSFDHAATNAILPSNVSLAYDGLVLNF